MSHKINPLVSVIIPLYNSEQYIGETIESVLNQTYKNIEIIIVDDGSTDNSLSIAKQYVKENVQVYHQSNKGAQVARNFGFIKSKGKYIQFIDSDDYISSRKIEKQVNLLENNDSMTIATSSVYVNKDNVCKLWNMIEIYRDFDSGFDLMVDLWRYFIPSLPHGAYLTPRTLVELTGSWDEKLLKNQDGDFFSRILSNVKKVVYVKDEGQIWRVRADSTSHKVSYKKTESVLYSYKKISDLMLSIEDSERVRQAIAVAYGSFIINDSDWKHGNLAIKRLRELNIKPNYRINSIIFKTLLKVLHPQIAIKLFKKIQHLRSREVYFSN